MKKIEFDEVRKIHVESVNSSHLVLVRKRGEAFGVIAYSGDKWRGLSNVSNIHTVMESFDGVVSWFGVDCEFYVLE